MRAGARELVVNLLERAGEAGRVEERALGDLADHTSAERRQPVGLAEQADGEVDIGLGALGHELGDAQNVGEARPDPTVGLGGPAG